MKRFRVPCVYIEVQPLDGPSPDDLPEFLPAAIKLQLIQKLFSKPIEIDEKGERRIRSFFLKEDDSPSDQLVVYLQQSNPFIPSLWPCQCQAFVIEPGFAPYDVIADNDTLVRILPFGKNQLHDARTLGLLPEPPLSREFREEVIANHNESTVNELSMHLDLLLANPVKIGTGTDSLEVWKRSRSHRQAFGHKTRPRESAVPSIFRHGCLIIHSPDHYAGKTTLAHTLVSDRCSRVHIIKPGALVAQYGIEADTALQRILHEIVIAAAVREDKVCILLDRIDCLLPPPASSKMSLHGDATIPVLNSIASFLKSVTDAIVRGEFVFPSSHGKYNFASKEGFILDVNVCIIGVTTVSDLVQQGRSSAMQSLNAGYYRLPLLSTETRDRALRRALSKNGIDIDPGEDKDLFLLAAAAAGLRGPLFGQVAAKAERAVKEGVPKLDTVRLSVRSCLANEIGDIGAAFHAAPDKGDSLLASIGGNDVAKKAIQDSLVLNDEILRLVYRAGISPPAGVLLYGPPGCGKTLLAKAVASLLKGGRHGIGGAFISVNSSDFVVSEVGSSEKKLRKAFENAIANSPSVLFIDEFQALFTERSSSGSGRLTSTLLQCMDDINMLSKIDVADLSAPGTDSKRVIVLAATNTPWLIDKAFLRPGRFDRVVFVDLPEMKTRASILSIHVGKMQIPDRIRENLAGFCETLAIDTEGYSGADLSNLCQVACVQCLTTNGESVTEHHFRKALSRTMSSKNDELIKKLKSWSARG